MAGVGFSYLSSLFSFFFPWGGNILAIPSASPGCHTLRTPYRESVCKVCGCGGGFSIPCFSLTLSPSSSTLWALGALWFLWRGWCLYACVCLLASVGALLCNFNILVSTTYAYVAGVVWGVLALNILVRNTIVSPWSVAIPYPLFFFIMSLLDLVSVFMYLAGA